MELGSTIGQFYEAALSEKSWEEALSVVMQNTGCFGAVLLSLDRPGKLYSATGNLMETNQRYISDRWYLLDHRYRAGPTIRLRGIASETDFITDAEMKQSAFYQDFILKSGLGWWAGLGVKLNGEQLCLGIQRTHAQGRFSPTELEVLKGLAPHLSRAVGLAEILETARTGGMFEVTEGLKSAAFALDSAGRVLGFNRRAEKFLNGGLSIRESRLHAAEPTDDKKLQELIAGATQSARYSEAKVQAIMLRNHGRGLVAQLLILESRHRYAFRGAAGLLVVTDLRERTSIEDEVFRTKFNLTAHECKFVKLLLEGKSVKETSELLSIRLSTARQYLKQILAKSDTHRQAELIVLLQKELQEQDYLRKST